MTAADRAAGIVARVQAALEAVRVIVARVRKAVVSVAGAAAYLLAAGLLPDPVAGYVAGALAVLAAVGVYAVPNAPPAAPAARHTAD